MSLRLFFGLPLALALTACAAHPYALVVPADAAGPVLQEGQRRFDVDPMRYAVGVADDRLSIQVENPTDDTVRLIGADSSVVDPAGRSHPLIDQTLAPRSYVRVVLPRLRPWAGGTYSVGEPTAIPAPTSDDPGYDRSSPVYWDWPGPGDVRVHLAYRRGDDVRFAHDLAFHRG